MTTNDSWSTPQQSAVAPASPASAPLGEGTTAHRLSTNANHEMAAHRARVAASAPPKGGEGLDVVQRYTPVMGAGGPGMIEYSGGGWVTYVALQALTARLRELEGERDEANKTVGVMSADFSRFHREVARALDPEHLLCIRDDDFGGQYADPLEVIAEMRAEVARLREAGADAERYCGATCDLGLGGTLRCGKSPHPKYVCHYDADRLVTFDDSAARRPAPGGET